MSKSLNPKAKIQIHERALSGVTPSFGPGAIVEKPAEVKKGEPEI